MALMTDQERDFAQAISRLVFGNPFLTERIDAERQALGPGFIATGVVWHVRAEPEDDSPNLGALYDRVGVLVEALRARLVGTRASQGDLELYEDLVLYLLFHRYLPELKRFVATPNASTTRAAFYPAFARDVAHYLATPAAEAQAHHDPAKLLALFFQIRRAFHLTFSHILGGSLPAARLRAAVWQSIFTHDVRRYRRALYDRMHDVTTLIVGPSGSGKELVARAIALSRYIPFDAGAARFTEDYTEAFYPLHLSALPVTLIESELFGHRRGTFTGAIQDRAGWLEVCPPLGTVFLDEIGEIDASIQVKLLRVLQERTFQRLGDTQERRFQGKIVAATNRDLAAEMQAGRFRQDFYYRLCADVIQTPSLSEQLKDSPGELPALLRFLAARIAGGEEGDALADEAERWIERQLGGDYSWPGNVRELEQCVRNVMIRGEYRPARPIDRSAHTELAAALEAGALTADELLRRYCTLVFQRTGSYQETARRLGIDRRTVKDKVDPALIAESSRAEAKRRP
jgi:DNA-binding NtrC family response regulator